MPLPTSLPMATPGLALADAPLSAEEPVITVTPKAAAMGKKQLADWSAEVEGPVYGLRLGVKGGGCSGYYYVYEVATKVRKKDQVWDFEGLRVVVDPRSLALLEGGVLDWEQRLMGYGFKWENPNATGDCGCGSSFNV